MYVITQLHSSVPVVDYRYRLHTCVCTGRREKTQKDDFKRLSFVFFINVTPGDVVQILLPNVTRSYVIHSCILPTSLQHHYLKRGRSSANSRYHPMLYDVLNICWYWYWSQVKLKHILSSLSEPTTTTRIAIPGFSYNLSF